VKILARRHLGRAQPLKQPSRINGLAPHFSTRVRRARSDEPKTGRSVASDAGQARRSPLAEARSTKHEARSTRHPIGDSFFDAVTGKRPQVRLRLLKAGFLGRNGAPFRRSLVPHGTIFLEASATRPNHVRGIDQQHHKSLSPRRR
jgi:hypothetical protein